MPIPEEARYLPRNIRYYALPLIIGFCVVDIGLVLLFRGQRSSKPPPGWTVIADPARGARITESESQPQPPDHVKPYNNLDAINN